MKGKNSSKRKINWWLICAVILAVILVLTVCRPYVTEWLNEILLPIGGNSLPPAAQSLMN